MTGVRRGVIVLLACLVIGGCGGSRVVSAPSTGSVPMPTGARVIASLVTENGMIGSLDHRRFRSMDIGSFRMNGRQLIRAEIRTLLSHGWKHLQITICCKETSVDGGVQENSIPAKLTNPQASAELDSPDGRDYIVIAILRQDPARFYSQGAGDTRSRDRSLQQVFRRHAAILDVTTAAINGH